MYTEVGLLDCIILVKVLSIKILKKVNDFFFLVNVILFLSCNFHKNYMKLLIRLLW